MLTLAPRELTPSRSAPLAEHPHPEEIRLLEELAAWSGDEEVASDPLLPFPEDRTLTSSVQTRAESFELFSESAASQDASAALLTEVPYGSEIERVARQNGVDALLVAAMIEAESSFRPAAISPKGALGLLQLMPGTARDLGVVNPTDPTQNLQAGTRYIRRMLHRFDGDLTLALAAYNAGPRKVEHYGGVPPYPETTRYVEKVLRRYVGHRQALWRSSLPAGDATIGPLATASAKASATVR